jgi:hypothetical protein
MFGALLFPGYHRNEMALARESEADFYFQLVWLFS